MKGLTRAVEPTEACIPLVFLFPVIVLLFCHDHDSLWVNRPVLCALQLGNALLHLCVNTLFVRSPNVHS